jgi:hypothetical protein
MDGKWRSEVRGQMSEVGGRTTDDACGRDDLDDLDGWRDVRGPRSEGEEGKRIRGLEG